MWESKVVLKANVSVSASSKMTAFGWRSLTLTLSITDGQPNNASTGSIKREKEVDHGWP